jgi:hypothetical protein
VWWDTSTTVARVLARLRLSPTDVDVDRVRVLVGVAAVHINNELDRSTPMTAASATDPDTGAPLESNVTPSILEALERVTVELYSRGKTDVRDGSIVVDTAAVVDVVRQDISSHKSRFGIS